jgi:hypothetical protein
MNIEDIDDLIYIIETTPNITKDEISTLIYVTLKTIVLHNEESTEDLKQILIKELKELANERLHNPSKIRIFMNCDISLRE